MLDGKRRLLLGAHAVLLLKKQSFVTNPPLLVCRRYQLVLNEENKRMELCPFMMNVVILQMVNNKGK